MQRQTQTHCLWPQTAHTGPEPTHSPRKNVMTCVPSGIFSLPGEEKQKKRKAGCNIALVPLPTVERIIEYGGNIIIQALNMENHGMKMLGLDP